jgi:Ser/Thr protein kinase RdoA (MazF antagonist)
VTFAHAVQKHLAHRKFPVTSLLMTSDERKTVLNIDNHIYELFRFVSGSRCDASPEATEDAGRQLANLHERLGDFAHDYEPFRGSFHDSGTVRQHLKMIRNDKRAGSAARTAAVTESLLVRYDRSAARVGKLGYDSWRRQVVHGDWHPGNLLFSSRKVVGVLDFDSIRIAPPVTDLANGMLQFSIIGDHPDPAQWPDAFDEARLFQFLNGYREVIKVSQRKLASLVDLMIEGMIAEAVLPVAATGYFGYHSGVDFLQMIVRKTKWLRRHRKPLTETMLA